jgi:HSP20 family protein
MLHDFAQEFLSPELDKELTGITGSFVPPVDIYEDAKKLSIKLEVPGIREEDLDIKLVDQTLTIHGERKLAEEEKTENFHRIERRYGQFTRSFTLPNTVDTEKVQAHFEHGVLTLELPKRPEAQPKQIKVSIGKHLEGKETKPAS